MPTKFKPTIMDNSGAVGTRMSLEEFGGKEEGWKHDHQGILQEMSDFNTARYSDNAVGPQGESEIENAGREYQEGINNRMEKAAAAAKRKKGQ